MKPLFVLPLLLAGCLCAGWGGQATGRGGNQGWGGQGARGGWGGQGTGGGWGGQGGSGGWGGQGTGGAWGQGGRAQGARGGWGQGGGAQGARGGWGQGGGATGPAWGRYGRSTDGQQYGATFIDTPDQYGYEANIPGAHSKFIGYRTGRSGGAEEQQGAGSNGGWPQQGGY